MGKICNRCGFDVHPSQRIKSKHTGLFYCLDLTECGRRAAGNLTYEEISLLARRVTCNVRSAA